MSTVQTLLTRCRDLGAEFIPQPGGKLKVRAPAPLPDAIRDELKQRKAEILALLHQSAPQPEFFTDAREEEDGWSCPHCGLPAVIDDVCLSDDRERTLTLWRCDPCKVVAVTPDAIRQPPSFSRFQEAEAVKQVSVSLPAEASSRVTEATAWLDLNLQEPRRIAEVCAQ